MTLARSMFPPVARLAYASIPPGLARQERERERALRRLAKLREKASAEIERLIAFLDASDPYAATELEDQIDDHPCDDRELDYDDSDREPSLGWTIDGVLGGHRDLEEQCDDEGVSA